MVHIHRASLLCRTGDFRRGVVGRLAVSNGTLNRVDVVQHIGDSRCDRRNRIHNQIKVDRRERVIGRVGPGDAQRVRAITQAARRREFPVTVGIRFHGAQLNATHVGDDNGTARRRLTDQLYLAVVGDFTIAKHARTTRFLDIIHHLQQLQIACARRDVNGDIVNDRAGVTCRIRYLGRELVFAINQRRGRRELPATVWVGDGDGTHRLAIIIDSNRAALLRFTGEGWLVVVGGHTVGQLTFPGTLIVRHLQSGNRIRRC